MFRAFHLSHLFLQGFLAQPQADSFLNTEPSPLFVVHEWQCDQTQCRLVQRRSDVSAAVSTRVAIFELLERPKTTEAPTTAKLTSATAVPTTAKATELLKTTNTTNIQRSTQSPTINPTNSTLANVARSTDSSILSTASTQPIDTPTVALTSPNSNTTIYIFAGLAALALVLSVTIGFLLYKRRKRDKKPVAKTSFALPLSSDNCT